RSRVAGEPRAQSSPGAEAFTAVQWLFALNWVVVSTATPGLEEGGLPALAVLPLELRLARTPGGAAKTSASDLEHLPLFREASDRQPVTDRLVGDRSQEDLGHRRQVSAAAQRGADVHLVVVQQAEVEASVGGEPHAVAGAAVRLGDGADEDNHSPGGREAVVAGLVRRVAGRPGLGRAQRGRAPGTAAIRARLCALGTSPPRATACVSPVPKGMVSMKRTCQGRSRVSAARGTTSSSLNPRTTTAFSLIGVRPAASAASMPAQMSASVPQRITR